MNFKIEISSSNAAMVDDTRGEVARILERTAKQIREGQNEGTVRDSTGNLVGSYTLTRDEE